MHASTIGPVSESSLGFAARRLKFGEKQTRFSGYFLFLDYDDGMNQSVRRVVVVDDERSIREMLEMSLAHRGFEVRTAGDGAAALPLVRDFDPDVIVLDVMMPRLDGFTLLPMLRRVTQAPIIMLSARGEVEDKVEGLASGADDYLSKPFEIAELVARLETALRRPELAARKVLSYAGVTVDLQTRRVHRGARELELSATEFKLLVAFMRNPERLLTREQLFELVWGANRSAGLGTVERTVSYLRAKLDEGSSARLIRTVRGVGYAMRGT